MGVKLNCWFCFSCLSFHLLNKYIFFCSSLYFSFCLIMYIVWHFLKQSNSTTWILQLSTHSSFPYKNVGTAIILHNNCAYLNFKYASVFFLRFLQKLYRSVYRYHLCNAITITCIELWVSGYLQVHTRRVDYPGNQHRRYLYCL
jgi:hypothetical protein